MQKRLYISLIFGILLSVSCQQDPLVELYLKPEIVLDNVVVDAYEAQLGYIISGNKNITKGGFYYGRKSVPTEKLKVEGAIDDNGKVTARAQELEANTEYHYWAYASNGRSEITSDTSDFITTTCTADLITVEITDITNNSASSGGTINKTGGLEITSKGICWSIEPTPTIALSTKTNDGTGNNSFTSAITGLTEGTTYYVRAYATNSDGTAYGDEKSFTTAAILPTLTTTAISNISYDRATTGGNISYNGGGAITTRGVCWSTSSNPTIALATKTNNGTGDGSFTSTISSLQPSTTYYVRAYATNSAGTAYGEEKSFITTSTIPTVVTTAASNPNGEGATSGGTITSSGGAPIIARGVCWSTNANPTIANDHTTDGSSIGTFTSTITGWSHGVTYHYRAYATNSNGTAYGEDMTFYNGNMWITKASLSLSNNSGGHEFSLFSIDGKCFVLIGDDGWDNNPYANFLWMYDPETNSWTRKASFPGRTRSLATAFSIGNDGYYGMGTHYSSGSEYYTDFWKYNYTSNSWSSITQFPTTWRWGSFVFSYNGKGYVGTGFSPSTQTRQTDVYSYNPSSNTWSWVTSYPGGGVYLADANVVGNYLYVGGGNASSGDVASFYRYNLSTNSWSSLSNPYSLKVYPFALNGMVYGTVWDEEDNLYQFNPLTNSWSNKGSVDDQRFYRSSSWLVVDNRAFYFDNRYQDKITVTEYIP